MHVSNAIGMQTFPVGVALFACVVEGEPSKRSAVTLRLTAILLAHFFSCTLAFDSASLWKKKQKEHNTLAITELGLPYMKRLGLRCRKRWGYTTGRGGATLQEEVGLPCRKRGATLQEEVGQTATLLKVGYLAHKK